MKQNTDNTTSHEKETPRTIISPTLFRVAWKDIAKNINWQHKDISIERVRLNHWQFTDDIAVINNPVDETKDRLKELYQTSLHTEKNVT